MDLSGVELVLASGVAVLLVTVLVLGQRLGSLRSRVERIERAGHPQPPLGSSGLSPDQAPLGTSGLSPDVEHEARSLVYAGKKIQAIKLVREHTGLGLKEAKDLVDRF